MWRQQCYLKLFRIILFPHTLRPLGYEIRPKKVVARPGNKRNPSHGTIFCRSTTPPSRRVVFPHRPSRDDVMNNPLPKLFYVACRAAMANLITRQSLTLATATITIATSHIRWCNRFRRCWAEFSPRKTGWDENDWDRKIKFNFAEIDVFVAFFFFGTSQQSARDCEVQSDQRWRLWLVELYCWLKYVVQYKDWDCCHGFYEVDCDNSLGYLLNDQTAHCNKLCLPVLNLDCLSIEFGRKVVWIVLLKVMILSTSI